MDQTGVPEQTSHSQGQLPCSWAGLSQGSEHFVHKAHPSLPLSAGSLYFVVQAYEAQKADELSLNQGVVVEVLRTSHNGWWLIR